MTWMADMTKNFSRDKAIATGLAGGEGGASLLEGAIPPVLAFLSGRGEAARRALFCGILPLGKKLRESQGRRHERCEII